MSVKSDIPIWNILYANIKVTVVDFLEYIDFRLENQNGVTVWRLLAKQSVDCSWMSDAGTITVRSSSFFIIFRNTLTWHLTKFHFSN